jgi:hypothetical protein
MVTLKDTIWAVMVVPTPEPNNTNMAWRRRMMPALTKPSRRRTVTLELCTRNVTTIPMTAPFAGFAVAFCRRFLRRTLVSFFNVLLSWPILNMNRAKPPMIWAPIRKNSITIFLKEKSVNQCAIFSVFTQPIMFFLQRKMQYYLHC